MSDCSETPGPSGKRAHTSPAGDEPNKRYLFEPDTLITNNKYYLLNENNTSTQEDSHTSETKNEPKKLKVPPIFLHGPVKYQEVIKDIEKLTQGKFTTACAGNTIKINLQDPDDYRLLTAFYDEHHINYHTFRNPHEANLSVVIRNVPISIENEEIKQELSKSFHVVSVTRLYNKEKVPIPICAVILKPTENSKEIFKITHLFHCIVAVEPRRKSSDIPQCHRCQNYGHTKNYCKLPPRCVKCLGAHLTTECKKDRTDKPQCVHCGEQHPANYKGCQHYLELKNNRQLHTQGPRINNIAMQGHTHTTTTAEPNLLRTYANVTSNCSAQQKTETNLPDVITNIITQIITSITEQIKNQLSHIIKNLLQNGSN